MRVSLAVEDTVLLSVPSSCSPDAAVCESIQETGAPPAEVERIYRSSGYKITPKQGGILPILQFSSLDKLSGSRSSQKPDDYWGFEEIGWFELFFSQPTKLLLLESAHY